eukprot:s2639_g1.t1
MPCCRQFSATRPVEHWMECLLKIGLPVFVQATLMQRKSSRTSECSQPHRGTRREIAGCGRLFLGRDRHFLWSLSFEQKVAYAERSLGVDLQKDSRQLFDLVQSMLEKPLPEPWRPCFDEHWRLFFYNDRTKVSASGVPEPMRTPAKIRR